MFSFLPLSNLLMLTNYKLALVKLFLRTRATHRSYLLWLIYGTFSSVIVNHLEQTSEDGTAVACIYCNYKEQNQTTINLVASLLQQLIQGQLTLSDDIITIYRRHTRKQTRPSLTEYSELLQSVTRRFSKVFIVVDALDECSVRNGSRGFLSELRKLPPNIHLLVTSRYTGDIEHEFAEAACLEISALDEDIRKYIETRIKTQPQLIHHIKVDPTIRGTILDTIVQKADGM